MLFYMQYGGNGGTLPNFLSPPPHIGIYGAYLHYLHIAYKKVYKKAYKEVDDIYFYIFIFFIQAKIKIDSV